MYMLTVGLKPLQLCGPGTYGSAVVSSLLEPLLLYFCHCLAVVGNSKPATVMHMRMATGMVAPVLRHVPKKLTTELAAAPVPVTM